MGPLSALLPRATPSRWKLGLLSSSPIAQDKTPPLTQLLRVEIEVHTGNCISVALKMPLQRGVLLGETRVKWVKLDEKEALPGPDSSYDGREAVKMLTARLIQRKS